MGDFVLELERPGQAMQDFLHDPDHVAGFFEFAEDDRKFIASKTGHGIGIAHALEQALCHLFKQDVAKVVAKGIVDGFESIQVDEDQRHGQLVAGCFFDLLAQAVIEHAPVGQAGKGVEVGLLPDRFFSRLLLRDIGEQGDVAQRITLVIEDGIEAQRDQVMVAVLVLVPDFAFPVAGMGNGLAHTAVELDVLVA